MENPPWPRHPWTYFRTLTCVSLYSTTSTGFLPPHVLLAVTVMTSCKSLTHRRWQRGRLMDVTQATAEMYFSTRQDSWKRVQFQQPDVFEPLSRFDMLSTIRSLEHVELWFDKFLRIFGFGIFPMTLGSHWNLLLLLNLSWPQLLPDIFLVDSYLYHHRSLSDW